jgi:hypothetical protein
LRLPNATNAPRPNHAAALTITAQVTTVARTFGSASESRSSARTRIRTRLTMIASTTYDCGMLIAGVRSICSCLKKVTLAGISSITKIAVITAATVSKIARTPGDERRSSTESRMCSSRR